MKDFWLESPVKGVLLDISGVLRDGDIAIPGSVDAFSRLKKAGMPVLLVTNESQVTRQTSLDKLKRLGYSEIALESIQAPGPLMAQHLKDTGLKPYLLIHPQLLPEFDGIEKDKPNCVVIGDAADHFSYDNLNKAFRALLQMRDEGVEPHLFSLGKGRYYKEDGELCLDVGAYTAALEYATDFRAKLFGKPSTTFFRAAISTLALSPDQVVMIGDDIVGDVEGAQESGIRGVLVRTGKYRPADESHPKVKPDAVVNDLAAAVDLILSHPNQNSK